MQSRRIERLATHALTARPCTICGVSFTPYRPDHKYCSVICRNRSRSIARTGSEEVKALNRWYYNQLKAERKGVMYREKAVKQKYGLTLAQYDALLAASPACALCGLPFDSTKHALKPTLDHNHKTGELRAFIHGTCNSGIGHLGDSSERLLQAVKYLRRYGA